MHMCIFHIFVWHYLTHSVTHALGTMYISNTPMRIAVFDEMQKYWNGTKFYESSAFHSTERVVPWQCNLFRRQRVIQSYWLIHGAKPIKKRGTGRAKGKSSHVQLRHSMISKRNANRFAKTQVISGGQGQYCVGIDIIWIVNKHGKIFINIAAQPVSNIHYNRQISLNGAANHHIASVYELKSDMIHCWTTRKKRYG